MSLALVVVAKNTRIVTDNKWLKNFGAGTKLVPAFFVKMKEKQYFSLIKVGKAVFSYLIEL